MIVGVVKLHKDAIIPTKANERDAGWDLYALEDTQIPPGETVRVRTGIAMQPVAEAVDFSNIRVGLLWDRSGMGSKGIHRLAGVIDEDYTGEIGVCLTNLNIGAVLRGLEFEVDHKSDDWYVLRHNLSVLLQDETYYIKKGDKIAQILFQYVTPVVLEELQELRQTKRGGSGFGSSGR